MDRFESPFPLLLEALEEQTADAEPDRGIGDDPGSEEGVDRAPALGNQGMKGEVSRW